MESLMEFPWEPRRRPRIQPLDLNQVALRLPGSHSPPRKSAMTAFTQARSAHLVVLADYRRRRALGRLSPWIAVAALVLLLVVLAGIAEPASASVPAGEEPFPSILID